MFRSTLAAATLIASLAACEAAGNDQPAAPEATETTAEGAAVSQSVPDRPIAERPSEPQSGEADASGCGADKLARWLNVLPTETIKAEIAATVGERRIRYIGPGDVVTMDFSPSRLNVELGEDGRIKRFRCG